MSEESVNRPYKGMVKDVNPLDQPRDSYSFALNAINESVDGNINFLTNELSNRNILSFPSGMLIIGSVRLINDEICVFGRNSSYNMSYIGILKNNDQFEIIVESASLNFSAHYPISATFRLRRNQQRVIYFVDGYNKPRIFNFDRLYDFYSNSYKAWLDNPVGVYQGEKWESSHFELIKSFKNIPQFTKVEVLNNGGTIPSGSYSAAIQLIDENLNPTEWISVSNPVRIYNDSLDTEYEQIRGSRNTSTDAQNFNTSSKSIKWTFSNLDENFSFYRVAVLQANAGNGVTNQALVSQLIPISHESFVYSGDDDNYISTPVSDISVESIDIASAKFVSQIENRLTLHNIKGKQIDYCSFQAKASKIVSDLVTEDVVLNNVNSIGNSKNPVSSFYLTGYMPGEVYSFGIVYIFKDGTTSPVFHIPGKPEGEESTDMDFYKTDSVYPDIHKCMSFDFWGTDAYGNSLVNTSVRHHKFPFRRESMFEKRTTNIISGYTNQLRVQMFWIDTPFHPSQFDWIVSYKVDGVIKNQIFSIDPSDESGKIFDFGTVDGNNVYVFHINAINEDPAKIVPRIEFNDATLRNIPAYKAVEETVAKTYGIKFSNIEKPHPDIVGFQIVRNERTESDKLIVDNAIIGPLTNFKGQATSGDPYHTFGLLLPNLDNPGDLSDKGVYIFSPEHQFKNKKLVFDSIHVNGYFERDSMFLPKRTGTTPNGAYVNDVQAGTTFNKEYHAGGDPDGFDLQVFYRSNFMEYVYDDTITLPNPTDLFYLSASANRTKSGDIFFNAGVDNKMLIGVMDIDPKPLFYDTPRVLTASLVRENTSAYANFIDRTYYKEHNNVIPFYSSLEETHNIFNGDSYISPITLNNSTYFDTKFADRDKKSKVWKIVLGSLLVVAAIAVNIIPGAGQAASAVIGAVALSTLTTLAVSYGVSLLTSGIQFEVMKKMVDEHYEAGLKVCLQDEDNNDDNYIPEVDDRFCWFTDQLANLYFESSVNINLRVGLTASVSDFYNNITKPLSDYSGDEISSSADNFESYLINKFTIVDREQSGGRLYLGFANAEIYDINPDFTKGNTEKKYYFLPITYECCSKEIETYPLRNFYSETSFQEEKLDNYRKFLPNNYRDIQGEFGEITNVFKVGNNLMIHTSEALMMLPRNLQERVNSELTTFIGTGDFFALEPIITNGNGSDNFQATIDTPFGVFYVSTFRNSINIFGQSNQVINSGINSWLTENIPLHMNQYVKDTFGLNFPHSNNVCPLNGVGFHATYDHLYKRILLTKIDYKPLIEFAKFIPDEIELVGEYCYDTESGLFGIVQLNSDNEPYLNIIPFYNEQFFENKSWTLSYSFVSQSWVSYHSYLPKGYLSKPTGLYSYGNILSLDNRLYKHHIKGQFSHFYNKKQPFIVEIISNSNPTVEKIYNELSFLVTGRAYSTAFEDFVNNPEVFFTDIIVYNNYQSTGLKKINTKSSVMKNDPAQFLINRTVQQTHDTVNAARTDGIWSINRLRNYVDNYESPLFLKDWQSLKSSYFIDKLPNGQIINLNKNWTELERIKGKYVIIRLIFNNFANNVQLLFNYSSSQEEQSLR